MRRKKTDPELPPLLPFEPGQASNGEFVPKERTRAHQHAAALAHEMAAEIARRRGLDRRRFLQGMGGIAVTLAAINLAGCDDEDTKDLPPGVTSGATYAVPTDADPDACRKLEGDEFIFDVQTHHVDPEGPWVNESPATANFFRAFRPDCAEADRLDCLSRYYYAHDIFLESDTSLAVLSDTPSLDERQDPLNFREMKRTRDIINDLSPKDTGRLRLHSIVVPNVGQVQEQLDTMQARAEALDVSAWKVYTPYAGSTGRGWFLDDPQYGIPLIEQARRTGVKTICAHKGLPLFGFDEAYASPRDIGVVAKAYPDVNFVVYHSGWYPGTREGPYDPARAERGVNTLIKSLLDNGVRPNSNVYAELGSTWRNIMSDRTQAAHLLGKLIKYVGEDNVLWGTDCVWTGSPQPQIVALRAFQMDPQFAQQYGYAPLTDEVKRKIFGLNAARLYGVDPQAARCRIASDEVERLRMAWREMEGDSHEQRYAARNPISRRGVLAWFAEHGGRWSLS
ncbi:MAG TPA: amidohydrolase family protein [Dehalococcoidia bacterium]|nr:amidohydrolase family protein [Dehalococcoidia bacterium]